MGSRLFQSIHGSLWPRESSELTLDNTFFFFFFYSGPSLIICPALTQHSHYFARPGRSLLALPAVVPRGSGLVWDNGLCVITRWNSVGDSNYILPSRETGSQRILEEHRCVTNSFHNCTSVASKETDKSAQKSKGQMGAGGLQCPEHQETVLLKIVRVLQQTQPMPKLCFPPVLSPASPNSFQAKQMRIIVCSRSSFPT